MVGSIFLRYKNRDGEFNINWLELSLWAGSMKMDAGAVDRKRLFIGIRNQKTRLSRCKRCIGTIKRLGDRY